jgi:hypothetical protein
MQSLSAAGFSPCAPFAPTPPHPQDKLEKRDLQDQELASMQQELGEAYQKGADSEAAAGALQQQLEELKGRMATMTPPSASIHAAVGQGWALWGMGARFGFGSSAKGRPGAARRPGARQQAPRAGGR